ncbi:MAG TPA: addiction module protein [Urbifossiella sp.]|nr:addiction module protein [Urbifossiella sp.]
MSPAAASVLNSALSLPEAERLEVAAALIDSADAPPGMRSAEEWEAEIARRSAEIDAGTAELIPWEVVRDRARERLLGRPNG